MGILRVSVFLGGKPLSGILWTPLKIPNKTKAVKEQKWAWSPCYPQ